MSWIKDIINPEMQPWEEFCRNRWQHDKIVRSTHGVNCTPRLLLGDLRQRRDSHVGDAKNRLSLLGKRLASL
jgi:hypothetical protein